jgi:glutamate/tyrosine decarboxylase-like PLP-dependent enzyme
MQTSLRNYARLFRNAKATGTAYTPPRLGDLLTQPAFRPLAQWLDQRGVNREELQTTLDHHLTTAREAGES